MIKLRYTIFIFLLCFGCASFSADNEIRRAGSTLEGSLRGLKLTGVVGGEKLGTVTLFQPTGVAIDLMGNILIADTGNDRVVKCDENGKFLAEVGGFGKGNGQFNRPGYIATDNGLNLYVVDVQNKRIQRLDQNLNFVSTIEFQPEGDVFGLGLPQGIGVNSAGEIFISDMEEDCIIKLDGFLEYERSFGDFTQKGGGLRDPKGICVDRKGEIYVADSWNDRVVVFDSFGNALGNIGEGVLREPSGVAVDRYGLVYVANSGDNTLVVFDSQGDVILEYGGLTPGLTSLSKPTDLKLYKGKRLLVVDSGNNRILIFEIVR